MRRTPDELLAEALELPEEARARLAQSLITSLDDGEADVDPEAVAQEWMAEASRRAAEIDACTVRTIPASEVFRGAREELRNVRARAVGGR